MASLSSRVLGRVAFIQISVVSAGLSIGQEALLPSSVFTRRIDEDKVASATAGQLSETGKMALGLIGEEWDETGRMPTMRNAMKRLCDSSLSITQDDFFRIVFILKGIQRSDVSKEQLLSVLSDWDSTLRSVQLKYEVSFTGGSRDGVTQRSNFALDGNKIYWDVTQVSTRGSHSPHRIVQSYDGSSWTHVSTYGQENVEQWGRGRNVIAKRQSLDTRERFLDSLNPLVLQKLISVNVRFDVPVEAVESIDQFVNGCAVFESMEVIDGRSCVCLASEYSYYYFCPDLGFALVSAQDNFFAFTKSGRVVERGNYEERIAEDFSLAGQSIWFPRRITDTIFRGKDAEIREIRITDIQLNEPVSDSLFTDVVPPGGLLIDPEHPVARRVAKPGDIEAALAGSLQPRASTKWLWIILADTLVLVLILSVLFLRKRRLPDGK